VLSPSSLLFKGRKIVGERDVKQGFQLEVHSGFSGSRIRLGARRRSGESKAARWIKNLTDSKGRGAK